MKRPFVKYRKSSTARRPAPVRSGLIASPMPGRIMSVNVRQGEAIKAGDTLLVMESMKIETPITAPNRGTVKEIMAAEGQYVSTGQPMLLLE